MTKRNYTEQVFYTWEDFVAFAEPQSTDSPMLSSRGNGEGLKWYGGLSFEDTVKLAREGWNKPVLNVEAFAAHVEANIDTTVFQTAFEAVRDVSGAEVDVSLYLAGEPECMVESVPLKISKRGRAVRVVVSGSASCVVKPKTIQDRGAALVALADILAKAQHPLEIWVSFNVTTYRNGGSEIATMVKVQDANDPLDVPRLLFALAHPGMLRRLVFSAWENEPNKSLRDDIVLSSYGTPNDANPDYVPDCPENTITLPTIGAGNDWSEDRARAWVIAQVEGIFS